MFELMQVYETVHSEKNLILKKFLLFYIRSRLKITFFKKFNIYMPIDFSFIKEFNHFFDCVTNIRAKTWWYNVHNLPYTESLGFKDKNALYIKYYDYIIIVYYYENMEEYKVEISRYKYGKNIEVLKYIDNINKSFISTIILIGIYNTCISYIFGFSSKTKKQLYKDDKSCLDQLSDLF